MRKTNIRIGVKYRISKAETGTSSPPFSRLRLDSLACHVVLPLLLLWFPLPIYYLDRSHLSSADLLQLCFFYAERRSQDF